MQRLLCRVMVAALLASSLAMVGDTAITGSPNLAAAMEPESFDPSRLDPEPEFARWGVVGKAPNVHALEDHGDIQDWTGPQPEVWDMVEIGDRVFVGGIFTGVRRNEFFFPDDTPHDQPFLAAFERDTGDWISTFTPQLDAPVYDLAATADGRLLVGGEFAEVNGAPRTGLVALDPITGATIDSFTTTVERPWSDDPAYIKEILVDGADIYVAGLFSHVTDSSGTNLRRSVARLDGTTGVHDPGFLVMTAGGSVWDLEIDHSRGRIQLVGYFTSLAALPDTNRMGTVLLADGTAISGLDPIPTNHAWNIDTVTVTRADDKTWIGGGNHLVSVLDPVTNATIFTETVPRAGDIQVIERLGDVMALGHHGRDGGLFFYDAATRTRLAPTINFLKRSYGVWAVTPTSDGCLWVGGDPTRTSEGNWVGGFGRFCPTADTDDDGIFDRYDTVPTIGASASQAGTASQSSDYSAATVAGQAIDGNRDGVWTAENPLASTANNAEAWWEVDLGTTARITGINVWNRTACCPERLSDFEVLVDDQPFGDVTLAQARAQAAWSTSFVGEAGVVEQFAVDDTAGRYVRVQLSGSNFLTLAEVDVFTDAPDNDGDGISDRRDIAITDASSISQNGTATQSGDWNASYGAENAIDGQRDASVAADLAHTASRTEPWWEVDLGTGAVVSAINIWNRRDFHDRLDGAEVLIGDTPFGDISLADARAQATWSGVIGDAGDVVQFAVPDRVGRYVRIQDPDTSLLNLVEVDVFGVASDLPPFGAPDGVVLTTNGVDEVTLSWEPVANAKGYLVHRDYQFIGWVPADQTSLLDPNVIENETYRYQVRAQALDNSYSPPSPVETITVFDPGDIPPFGAPADVVLTTNGVDQVTVEWQQVADAKGYIIHRDYQFIAFVPFTASSWTDTDVVENETYRYQVRAQAADNSFSAPSTIQSVTVFDVGALPPFGAPADATATTDGVDTATVEWEQVADATGYIIHRDYQFVKWVPFTVSSWTDTGLAFGNTYRYQVRAQAADGSFSAPTPVQAVTIGTDVTPPSTPANVTANRSADGTEITVTWDAATDDVAVAGYLIHDNWSYVAWVPAGTTFVHTGLDPDSVHRYQVRARDTADNLSAPSDLLRVDPNA